MVCWRLCVGFELIPRCGDLRAAGLLTAVMLTIESRNFWVCTGAARGELAASTPIDSFFMYCKF